MTVTLWYEGHLEEKPAPLGVCSPVQGAAEGRRGTGARPQRPAARCKPCPSARRGLAPCPGYNSCSLNSERKNETRPGGYSPEFPKAGWDCEVPRSVGGFSSPARAGTARHRPVLPPSARPGRRAMPREHRPLRRLTQHLRLGNDASKQVLFPPSSAPSRVVC